MLTACNFDEDEPCEYTSCAFGLSYFYLFFEFLLQKIGFLDMINIIEKSLEKITFVQNPKLEDLLEIDLETRKFAKTII